MNEVIARSNRIQRSTGNTKSAMLTHVERALLMNLEMGNLHIFHCRRCDVDRNMILLSREIANESFLDTQYKSWYRYQTSRLVGTDLHRDS